MSQALFLNYLYIALDVAMLVLGLLFVWKWGKRGLLAITLWLFVIGLMALTAGDMLATLAENFDRNFVLNEGGYYEVSSKDFAYIPAVIIWIAAFAIPIKFAFFDANKKPQGGEGLQGGPPAAQQQPPPPQQQMPSQQQAPPPQMPPPQQAQPRFQGQAPPPPYQQAPPPPYQQAPPPPYQQQPPR